ncbi:MAG: RagB/SusD family nutrient uptake outer membrane protein [Flavisolibacter sp.]|nr:RagB/SusD family nutrient uptake outer membrane protein [Flavisolibacter sp.]
MKHLTILLILITFTSCKKFLDKKNDKALAVPSTLQDAQALLDNYTIPNTFYSSAGAQSDDDYYLDDAFFNTMSVENQNNYTWQKEAYNPTHWNLLYNIVYYANNALETVNKIKPVSYNQTEYNSVKGQALFFRSYALWHIAQYWSVPYNKATASADLGIPLRLSTDPNIPSKRSSVEQTYEQIIADLKEAAALLPVNVPITSRPSKAAAFGALARTFLTMREYDMAGRYADSCLQLYNTLINYNTISQTSATPFPAFNSEVILQTQFSGYAMLTATNWKADSFLYKSYDANDLRRALFFMPNGTGSYGFKGSYNAITSGSNFNGIAVDEMYLIRAECNARAGKKDAALNDLNTLLFTRWRSNTWSAVTATDADDALKKILTERRKELVGRGLRWLDLRRLNKEAQFQKTLIRKANGTTYTLLPDDNRYTFYIPQSVIDFTGMPQNSR